MPSLVTIHRDWLKQIPKEGIFVTPAALVAADAYPTEPVDEVSAVLSRATGDGGVLIQPTMLLLDPAAMAWPKDRWTTLLPGEDGDALRAAFAEVDPLPAATAVLGALRAPDPATGWIALAIEDNDMGTDAAGALQSTSRAASLGRALRTPLIVLFGRREIRLIHAPLKGPSAWVSFPLAQLVAEDGLLLGALHMLIGERRLLSLPDDKRLPALLAASRATKIKSLDLKGFSTFLYGELGFAPGINVFLGPNGSGKTHVLKGLYALLRGLSEKDDNVGRRDYIARKLAGVLKPEGDDLSRLVHWSMASAMLRARAERGEPAELSFDLPGNVSLVAEDAWSGPEQILYLPTREVLTLNEGLAVAYQTRQIAFDETIYDACLALEAPLLRTVPEALENLLPRLEHILGGSVELRGNRFYLRRGDRLVEAQLLAEGIRKVASVARLIANGSIASYGALIWDEPEGNLNPVLVVAVADLLVDLAAQGVQIFVASHDYLLVRRLSLIAEYKKHPEVPIRFFGFCPTPAGVTVEMGEILADLAHNPILDEFTRQADFEQALFYEISA